MKKQIKNRNREVIKGMVSDLKKGLSKPKEIMKVVVAVAAITAIWFFDAPFSLKLIATVGWVLVIEDLLLIIYLFGTIDTMKNQSDTWERLFNKQKEENELKTLNDEVVERLEDKYVSPGSRKLH